MNAPRTQTLAKDLGRQFGLDDRTVYALIRQFLQRIELATVASGRMQIRGFGTFKVRTYNYRFGRHPTTGEMVPVTPMPRIVFEHSTDRQRQLFGHAGAAPLDEQAGATSLPRAAPFSGRHRRQSATHRENTKPAP